jgi:hypothetical protein
MKTVRISVVLASITGAASLLLAAPALSATPGMGWDVFYTGEGERIESSYDQATGLSAVPGQGFDAFRSGDGVRISSFDKAYMGTSLGSAATAGWDTFRVGDGDALP